MVSLSGIRISHKITGVMIALVIGFIIIGIAYYFQTNEENTIQESYQNTTDLVILASDANHAQLEMRELASKLLLTNQQALIDDHNQVFEQLTQDLAKLGELADTSYSKSLRALNTLSKQYQQLFAQVSGTLSQRPQLTSELNRSASRLGLALGQAKAPESLVNELFSLNANTLTNPNNTQQMLTQYEQNLLIANVSDATESQWQAFEQAAMSLASYQSRAQELNLQLSAIGGQLDQLFLGIIDTAKDRNQLLAEEAKEQSNINKAIFTALLFSVATATAIGMYLIYKDIVFPLAHMQNIIRRVNAGKMKARVGLTTNDELGDLGRAFNRLLDERIQALEEQSLENERLNNSIISLIKALSLIANKDLTIKVPVSPDITGAVSDAVNLLTVETAKTLYQVKDISEQVEQVSQALQNQSDLVIKVASDERKQVMQTSRALEHSTQTMNAISEEAKSAGDIAKNTIANTQQAMQTVSNTVEGILGIRETISETEKRIKRLGDRSQEITGIVNVINTIAERTHILALNASMHAASAGEAGKGFAVVAEEVQRLAEKAREATNEISTMVGNIRSETADAVTTMNTLIEQVAEGSQLAEEAGQSMAKTEQTTRSLVEKVLTISKSSTNQAVVAKKVRDYAALIRRYSEQTERNLNEQRQQTELLQNHSSTLVERVNIFNLPEDSKPIKPATTDTSDSEMAEAV